MNGINIKDLSIIGVLSSLAFALNMFIATLITPFLGNIGIYAHVGPSLFASGVIFIVMLKKVKKSGCFILFGVVFSIMYCFIGLWQMGCVIIPAVFLGEIILLRNGYNSFFRILIAYTVYGVLFSLHPGFFVWVLGKSGFSKQFPGMFTEDKLNELINNYASISFTSKVAFFSGVFALVGGVVGVLLYKKYFTEENKTSLFSKGL
ncbi:hypothetical protein CE665_24850 [Salmonella enterica subsp. enterica serovar Poona]|nr:MptD family putative ECF transporter S component [Salmonella enterica]EDJ2557544.1 hypothetical protein [Salmonella enterica subsp. enterica serovar Poona]